MAALTWFALTYGILFVISLISFNYWLSLALSFLGVFLIIVLCVKFDALGNEKSDETWTTKKIMEPEHQIKELKEKQFT